MYVLRRSDRSFWGHLVLRYHMARATNKSVKFLYLQGTVLSDIYLDGPETTSSYLLHLEVQKKSCPELCMQRRRNIPQR